MPMLYPKRTKFRKYQKGPRPLGGDIRLSLPLVRRLLRRPSEARLGCGRPRCQVDGTHLSFGKYGIKACQSGRISYQTIEAARRAISRKFRRSGQIWVRVFADIPITSKPTEVRMGKGKGNPTGWIARISEGQILFEMDGITFSIAKQAAVLVKQKLNISTKFVEWS